MLTVRAEGADDGPSVRRVNVSAFGRPDEAALVDALRDVARPQLSLVGVLDGEVVGHIFFSPVSIEMEDSAVAALALGPMAVLPEFQNQGVGSTTRPARAGRIFTPRTGGGIRPGTPGILPALRFQAGRARGTALRIHGPGRGLHGGRVAARRAQRAARAGEISTGVRQRVRPAAGRRILKGTGEPLTA